MATTWDPANKAATITLSGGNLTATSGTAAVRLAHSTVGYSAAGKRYFELILNDVSYPSKVVYIGFGKVGLGTSDDILGSTNGFGLDTHDGKLYSNGVLIKNYAFSGAAGDIISLLFDMDAATLEVWHNGVSKGTQGSIPAGSWHPVVGLYGNSGTVSITANFGGSAYAYTPTAGYDNWADPPPPPTPGNIAMTMEPLTMSAARIASISASLPAMTMAGGHNGIVSGSMEMMLFLASGGSNGLGLTMEPLTMEATGHSATAGFMTMEPLTMEATGSGGLLLTGDLIVPPPVVASTADTNLLLTMALTAPSPALTAALSNPGTVTLALLAAAPRLAIAGYVGQLATAALTAPVPELVIVPAMSVVASARLVVPPAYLVAVLTPAIGDNYRTWVLNTRRAALTEYDLEIDSYAEFAGAVLACTPDGVVVLGAQDLDDDAPISARWRLGKDSYESSLLKRIPRLYANVATNGDLLFRTITNEGGTRTYSLPYNGSSELQQRRVPIGKGPKSRYWQFEMENVNGADFGVNDLLVYPIVLRRRVQ